jgi:hypothetical protein
MSVRLTRGRLVAAFVALVALAAGVLLVVYAGGWWQGRGGSYAPKRMLASTSVTPSRSLFGQVITATVRVVVDPRRIDPASVQVKTDFRPYSTRSEHDRRTRIGEATVLSFSYELQCLSAGCVPRGATGRAKAAATAFTLRDARVSARERDAKPLRVAVAWPAFGVQSRLTAADIALGEPEVERPFRPPAVTWRLTPNLVGGLAAGLSLLLLLGGGALVASVALADGRPLRVLRIPAHMTPVERALALAEYAAKHGETEESRKALERLAEELRRKGAAGQADAAERLAWSASHPTPENVAVLAHSVRSNGAR